MICPKYKSCKQLWSCAHSEPHRYSKHGCTSKYCPAKKGVSVGCTCRVCTDEEEIMHNY
jgi:hypothetical protein